jgi:hypothetical protein
MKIRQNQLLTVDIPTNPSRKLKMVNYMASSKKKRFFCIVGYNPEEIFHILNYVKIIFLIMIFIRDSGSRM